MPNWYALWPSSDHANLHFSFNLIKRFVLIHHLPMIKDTLVHLWSYCFSASESFILGIRSQNITKHLHVQQASFSYSLPKNACLLSFFKSPDESPQWSMAKVVCFSLLTTDVMRIVCPESAILCLKKPFWKLSRVVFRCNNKLKVSEQLRQQNRTTSDQGQTSNYNFVELICFTSFVLCTPVERVSFTNNKQLRIRETEDNESELS